MQVALRLNSKGGRKMRGGDTVYYVICQVRRRHGCLVLQAVIVLFVAQLYDILETGDCLYGLAGEGLMSAYVSVRCTSTWLRTVAVRDLDPPPATGRQ